MACLVKNTVLSSAQEEDEYEDWSDDEESELKMEQIAANRPKEHMQSSETPVNEVKSFLKFFLNKIV